MLRATTRISVITLASWLFLPAGGSTASGQCILANPSFELGGSGGQTFGGWDQFGLVGSTTNATHGQVAARVSGLDTGQWSVSAYWQRRDTSPGERWSVTVDAWHSATNPLMGQSLAIVNIEWRDASDSLLAYESHTAADAGTPVDEVQAFVVESGPAPSGTVATHLLLGVLQGPTDPTPDVYYDQATFDPVGPPSVDDLQWPDFPGGRVLAFSGFDWRVKGPGFFGPGPNLFDDSAAGTWVDGTGRLHLTIRNVSGSWYSTEVVLEDALGYGDYVFTTSGRLDLLDPNAVLGLFLWQYGPCYEPQNGWWNPFNEIDVEFSRWGDPEGDPAQFVVQPWDFPGNRSRFDATFAEGEVTSHAFRWSNDQVEFRSWRGGPSDESPGNLIHSWTYTGPHIPRPEQPRIHLNLWKLGGSPAAEQEVVIDRFTFVPDGPAPVGVIEDGREARVVSNLLSVCPNPFQPQTTLSYALARAAVVELDVYDVTGRLVRTLRRGPAAAGRHEVVWDGRDEAGRQSAAGVYLCQLRAGGAVETRRLVRVH